MPSRAVIDDFLAQEHLAFVGASHDPKEFSATVYRELRDRGYDLHPVNPTPPRSTAMPAWPPSPSCPTASTAPS
ncbi:MAG: CoA-binding protein [Acidimicrobiales bacterium]